MRAASPRRVAAESSMMRDSPGRSGKVDGENSSSCPLASVPDRNPDRRPCACRIAPLSIGKRAPLISRVPAAVYREPAPHRQRQLKIPRPDLLPDAGPTGFARPVIASIISAKRHSCLASSLTVRNPPRRISFRWNRWPTASWFERSLKFTVPSAPNVQSDFSFDSAPARQRHW